MALAKGKVFLVTGAAAGIGRASPLVFAREGARVAVIDDHDAGEKAVAIIEANGGNVVFVRYDASSSAEVGAAGELGKGSPFWFDLDLPVAAGPPPVPEKTCRHIVGYTVERRRILIVDDRPLDRQLLVDVLEPLGLDVSTAEIGRDALDAVSEWHPDAVVMDQVAPDMTGAEAAQEITQRPRSDRSVIIAASASVLEADRAQRRAAGCDAFLPRPIDQNELLDVLATSLRLEWIYGESAEAQPHAPLVFPPDDELARLSQCARAGRIVDVHEQLTRIAEMGEEYGPFVDRVRDRAQGFEMDEIVAFSDEVPQGRSE